MAAKDTDKESSHQDRDQGSTADETPQKETKAHAQPAEGRGNSGVIPPGTRAPQGAPPVGIRTGEPVPGAPSTAGMAASDRVPGTGQTGASAQPVAIPEEPERRKNFQFDVDQNEPIIGKLDEQISPHYQRAAEARRNARELANLEAYGQGDSDRAQAIRRELEHIGYVPDDADTDQPVGRTARQPVRTEAGTTADQPASPSSPQNPANPASPSTGSQRTAASTMPEGTTSKPSGKSGK